MFARDLTSLPVLLYSIDLEGEGAGLVRFCAEGHGALAVRGRGLGKPASKLAPLLKPADELVIDLARGRGRTPVLTGVRLGRSHARWRASLPHQALQWFMVECAYTASGEQAENERVFRLIVNLLRREPPADELAGSACAFCLKFLAIHGLLPDLLNCAVSGNALSSGEPAFLLPTGEGFVSLETYNSRYARSGRGLVRLESPRLPRWRRQLSGALLDYPDQGFDETDAALLIGLGQRVLSDTSARHLASATFLARQWGLKSLAELAVEQRD
jgi:recombinational DNA repair protein (RecF pathway)